MNPELNLLCIYRATEYSPNMEDKDATILNKVSQHLVREGHHVTLVHEEVVTPADCRDKDVIFSMARRPSTLNMLSRLKQKVINPPQSVELASRRSAIFESCSPDLFPLWVKKANGYSQQRDDIIFAESQQALHTAIQSFRHRGITDLFLSRHIEGDLIKFYGVASTGFFFWTYASGGFSKFGWEAHNGSTRHYPFSEKELEAAASALSRKTGLQIYGGDCIISSDGQIHIIDFNDWPSFAPCQDEASTSIASLVTENYP